MIEWIHISCFKEQHNMLYWLWKDMFPNYSFTGKGKERIQRKPSSILDDMGSPPLHIRLFGSGEVA